MNIPLQINGSVIGAIDDTTTDEAILALVQSRIVRVPGKLINIVIEAKGYEQPRTRFTRWSDEKGDHFSVEYLPPEAPPLSDFK